MPKINILDSFIYNRIAAGEVVERPASVVKELIENSIDAAANNITVEVFGGGLKSIIITDNGCGIDQTDVKNAFLPHATSKVSSIDDLDTISTLGFRGEALASISSVSHTTLVTRTEESDVGVKIEASAGEVGEIDFCSANVGTRIEVADLFYNTPARLKFLKSAKSEENHITHIVSRIIFANPFIAFRYFVDGKLVFNTTGNDLPSAIYEIWGKEIYKKLLYVSNADDENSKIKIYGYISHPTLTKSNKNHQVVMVNGRVIVDQNISYVVQNAYQDLIMKKNFPLFILDIIMPFDDVDVNVHPAKTEVRFSNPHSVYGAIYNTVKRALSLDEPFSAECIKSTMSTTSGGNNFLIDMPNVDNNDNNQGQIKIDNTDTYITDETFDKIINTPITDGSGDLAKDFIVTPENAHLLKGVVIVDNDPFPGVPKEPNPRDLEAFRDYLARKDAKNKKKANKPIIRDQLSFAKDLQEDLGIEKVIIGQLFKTYLLVESNKKFYIIDQHAAHERLLYDKLLDEYNRNDTVITQPMLVPFIKTFSATDYELVSARINDLNSLGFIVDEFGSNTIKISGIPLVLNDVDFKKLFNELLKEGNEYKKITTSDLKREKLARTACRAAVKGGTELSNTYIDQLIVAILNSRIPLRCPHGRPIIISYSKEEVEKWFKRKV